MRKRTLARELALKGLYQIDIQGLETLGQMGDFLRAETARPEVFDFARNLLQGSLDKRADLDRVIRSLAENWELERMAVLDRNILRLGVYELLFMEDVPPIVAINEAIELAKKYSTEQSGGFVNGVLDKVRQRRGALLEELGASRPAGPSTRPPTSSGDSLRGKAGREDV